jgi:hypothetical protein
MLEIRFANAEQATIADMLWACKELDEVEAILAVFPQAQPVYEMIVAAAIDEQVAGDTEFPQVLELLESVK